VLIWGILGAFVMRGVMIGLGAALVARFEWVLYLFGAFLLITGVKMIFAKDDGVDPEKNPVIRLARRFFPVSKDFDGQKFSTVVGGRTMLTPLALVLLMVETTDLVFAVDSIPAIFGITRDPFIVFTSNVFAILGLRSLYFVLAGAISYFRYLKVGLSFVLVFIGIKMLLDPHAHEHGTLEPGLWFQFDIPTSISFMVIAGILLISVGLSVVSAKLEGRKFKSPVSGAD
jgi:tellurite resistance protein TerC